MANPPIVGILPEWVAEHGANLVDPSGLAAALVNHFSSREPERTSTREDESEGGDHDLHMAAAASDVAEVRRLLDAGMAVDSVDPRGRTPLMLASGSAVADDPGETLVKELLQRSADVRARDHSGWTCLHHACRNGRVQALKALLPATADVMSVTNDKKTALMLAAVEGSAATVQCLLAAQSCELKAFIKATDETGATALHYAVKGNCGMPTKAARTNSLKVAKLLVKMSAAVNARDGNDWGPLTWAARGGDTGSVAYLVSRKAEVDHRDTRGRGAVYYAAHCNHEHIACRLLRMRADSEASDEDGISPLDIANNLDMAQFRAAWFDIMRSRDGT